MLEFLRNHPATFACLAHDRRYQSQHPHSWRRLGREPAVITVSKVPCSWSLKAQPHRGIQPLSSAARDGITAERAQLNIADGRLELPSARHFAVQPDAAHRHGFGCIVTCACRAGVWEARYCANFHSRTGVFHQASIAIEVQTRHCTESHSLRWLRSHCYSCCGLWWCKVRGPSCDNEHYLQKLVLITGGSGLLERQIVAELIKRSFAVEHFPSRPRQVCTINCDTTRPRIFGHCWTRMLRSHRDSCCGMWWCKVRWASCDDDQCCAEHTTTSRPDNQMLTMGHFAGQPRLTLTWVQL